MLIANNAFALLLCDLLWLFDEVNRTVHTFRVIELPSIDRRKRVIYLASV